MAPDHIAEMALIEMSRLQRAAMARKPNETPKPKGKSK